MNRIDIQEKEGVIVANIPDEKITSEDRVEDIKTQILDYLAASDNKTAPLVIDASGVETLPGPVSEALAGSLIEIHGQISTSGRGKLNIAGLNDELKEGFTIKKLDTLFNVEDTVDQAIEAAQGRSI